MTDHSEARPHRPLSFLTESVRERALRSSEEEDPAVAVVELQVLIDIDPSDLDVGLRLARHLVELGRHARAADEYLRLAGVYAGLGEDRRARTVALRALQLDPSRAVRSRLAPLVAGLGREAAALCEQVSRVHMLSGRPEEARDVLRLLVEVDPTELSRRLRVAELELAAGHTVSAIAELRIVADGLRSHGRTEELVRVLEMMHQHGGHAEDVLRELSTIYVRCGQPRRALPKLELLHRIAPHDRTALERLARLHASLGRLELSLRLLERLVWLIDEQADRGELRAMLRRAGAWSSEASFQRTLEDLSVRSLRPGGLSVSEPRAARPAVPPCATRRRSAPPPLPRWTRSPGRCAATAGDLYVIDVFDAELLPDDDAVSSAPTPALVAE